MMTVSPNRLSTLRIRTNVLSVILALTLSVAGFSAASAQQDSSLSCERLLPFVSDSSINVTSYSIKLSADPTTHFLSGSVGIGVRITKNADQIFFSMSDSLHIRSLRATGSTSVAAFNHANDRLCITLSKTLGSGAYIVVTIDYEGNAPYPGYVVDVQRPNGNAEPLSYTFNEPYKAPLWFPCKNDPADKADSVTLAITCNNKYSVVSNGLLRSVTDINDTFHTFTWREQHPIAVYLIAFAVSEFDVSHDFWQYSSTESLPIDYYVFKSFAPAFDSSKDDVRDMLSFFSSKFGHYPFLDEKYGIAQFLDGGMEHQTVSFVQSPDLFLLAHETAHQWFGDKITCKNWNDIWLNEGFATYLTSLYNDKRFGHTAFERDMASKETDILNFPGGSVIVPDSELTNTGRIFDGRLSYNKGAWVLHMLRDVVGEDVFFLAMKSYITGPYSYGVVTTSDFQKSVEQSTNTDLDWFFKQWVYGSGYPLITAQLQSADLGGTFPTTLRLMESTSDASVPFYRTPIEARFRGRSLDTTVRVWFNFDQQVFNFEFTGKPDSVTLDPDNHILGGSYIFRSVTDRTRGSEQASVVLHRGEAAPIWLSGGRLWQITGTEVTPFVSSSIEFPAGFYQWQSRRSPKVSKKLLILP